MKQLRRSVWTIWILIVTFGLTLAVVIYWSFETRKESTLALQSAFEPNQKALLTNELFKAIVQSDHYLSSYILTGDSAQLNNYNSLVIEADGLLRSLGDLIDDEDLQQQQIDTLSNFLNEKARVSDLLIELKTKRGNELYSEKALKRIRAELSDTVYTEKVFAEKTDVLFERDTIELQQLVVTPDDYKGLRGTIRRLFGKERVQIDTVITQKELFDYRFELSVDSTVIRDYYRDSTIVAVNSILTQILSNEIKLQNDLRRTELQILSYNEVLVQSVRDLLKSIETANSKAILAKRNAAKQKISDAQRSAFTIATIGLFAGLLLFIIFIRDVSQANIYRKKLIAQKEHAEELARSKELFLSSMSHEIRTPLHSISGYSELLKNAIEHEPFYGYLQGLSSANEYLKELVNNILEQAKIESGQFVIEKDLVNLQAICDSLDYMFQFTKQSKSLAFLISINEAGQKNWVITDGMRIKQILVNLLSNAFKFTSEGVILLDIKLESSDDQKHLHFQVSDTGCGVAEEDLARVFEPFSQAKQGQKLGLGGSGLGLAITKRIVESLNGSITVKSVVNEGSTFDVKIPVEAKEIKEYTQGAIPENDGPVFFPIHLVIVEDDFWNANLIKSMLQDKVYSIQVFHSAEDALAYFTDQNVVCDLVMTDLNLPGVSGHEFLTLLRNRLKWHVPVMAFSAGLHSQSMKRLEKEGFISAFSKPFSKADLFYALSSLDVTNNENDKISLPLNKPGLSLTSVVQLIQGNPEEKSATLRSFGSAFQEKIDLLKAASDHGDAKELARISHQLRSACDQIGEVGCSERLHSVEVFEGLGNFDRALELSKQLIPDLEAVYHELHSEVELIISGSFTTSKQSTDSTNAQR